MKHFLAPLLLSTSLLTLAACDPSEEVRTQLDELNYCETVDDCVYIGSKCPFGCYIYANTAEEKKATMLLESYDSDCVYSCIRSTGIACVNNKCEVKTGRPAAPDENVDE